MVEGKVMEMGVGRDIGREGEKQVVKGREG